MIQRFHSEKKKSPDNEVAEGEDDVLRMAAYGSPQIRCLIVDLDVLRGQLDGLYLESSALKAELSSRDWESFFV
jgi:hypothetical protein